MSSLFLLIALLIGLLIAGLAFLNNQVVTLNYYFGQINLTLFMLILGSAVAGALVIMFFGFYRSIRKYVNSQSERKNQKELQRRVDHLEKDKSNLQADLGKRQSEHDDAVSKASDDMRNENKKLQAELEKQNNRA